MAGLSSTGFESLRFDDVVTALIPAWRGATNQNQRVDDSTPDGQIIKIMSERFASLWAVAESVYGAYGLGAGGASLDEFVALAGISRLSATSSSVVVALEGDVGTSIPSGSIIRDEATTTEWEIADTVVIPVGGTIDAVAVASVAGPIVALQGTTWEIVTPVTGWDGSTNAEDATVGTLEESDAALRRRFLLSFRSSGASVDAIRSTLLRLADVTSATVFENTSETTDSEGRPPHSFEAVVRGGDDQDIFDAIWAVKPAGIQTYGNTSGTAVDSAGDARTIAFSRPEDIDVYIAVTYSLYPEAAADDVEDLILAEILDYGSTLAVGQDIAPFPIMQHIETPGIKSMSIAIGLSASPTETTPLEISNRQLADIDSSRVTFTRIA